MSAGTTESGRRRSAVVTIFTDDYLDRIRDLEARAEALEEAAIEPQLLSEVPEYLPLAQEHDDLVKEAEAKATRVTVQAPRRTAWKKLMGEHPARTGKDAPELDAFFDFNSDTMPDPVAKLCIVSVQETAEGEVRDWSRFSAEEMDDFLDDLGEGDFRRIWQTAVGLYRGVSGDTAGKADLVSRMSQPKDETSN